MTMQIITQHIIPLAGAITCNLMFISPWKAVNQVQATSKLGDLNPIPYPLAIVSSTSWLLYSFAVQDYYLFAANFLGMLLSYYFTMVTFAFSPPATQKRISLILVVGMGFLFTAAMVDWIVLHGAKKVIGIATDIALVVYFMGPLLTLAKVVKTKNSAYFDVYLALGATLASAFWGIYGVFVKDLCIIVPNGLGLVCGISQLTLIAIYPRRAMEAPTLTEKEPL